MRSHISSTREAIDFCTSRRAKIWFDEWALIKGGAFIPKGLSCRIIFKGKNFYGKTLIKTVNNYIDYRNKIEAKQTA